MPIKNSLNVKKHFKLISEKQLSVSDDKARSLRQSVFITESVCGVLFAMNRLSVQVSDFSTKILFTIYQSLVESGTIQA